MKKKIIQSKLTKNNNLSKTKETEKVLEKMVAALNAVSYTHLTLPTT